MRKWWWTCAAQGMWRPQLASGLKNTLEFCLAINVGTDFYLSRRKQMFLRDIGLWIQVKQKAAKLPETSQIMSPGLRMQVTRCFQVSDD